MRFGKSKTHLLSGVTKLHYSSSKMEGGKFNCSTRLATSQYYSLIANKLSSMARVSTSNPGASHYLLKSSFLL